MMFKISNLEMYSNTIWKVCFSINSFHFSDRWIGIKILDLGTYFLFNLSALVFPLPSVISKHMCTTQKSPKNSSKFIFKALLTWSELLTRLLNIKSCMIFLAI